MPIYSRTYFGVKRLAFTLTNASSPSVVSPLIWAAVVGFGGPFAIVAATVEAAVGFLGGKLLMISAVFAAVPGGPFSIEARPLSSEATYAA